MGDVGVVLPGDTYSWELRKNCVMKVPRLWKQVGLAVTGLLAFEAAVRIVAPGLNPLVLSNYLRSGGSWLLMLYDRLGGGGLSRGGALALGIMPYISARIMVRLARLVSPALEAAAGTPDGDRSLSRWTRALTVGLALVQSYGFARFVQGIPGAVAHPGIGFVAQTMLVLTSGSVVAMALSERIARPIEDDDEPIEPKKPVAALESGERIPDMVNVRDRETVS
jgi:preprotein translocase subunit SecY